MFCIDLCQGYQQILVTPRTRRIQGGRVWLSGAHLMELKELGLLPAGEYDFENGQEVCIRSMVMTFGNARSVPVFTKLTRQVVRLWRSRG